MILLYMYIAEVYMYYTYMQEPDKMMQCLPDGIYVYSTIATQENMLRQP